MTEGRRAIRGARFVAAVMAVVGIVAAAAFIAPPPAMLAGLRSAGPASTWNVYLPFGQVYVDARTRATQRAAASLTPRSSPSATRAVPSTPTATATGGSPVSPSASPSASPSRAASATRTATAPATTGTPGTDPSASATPVPPTASPTSVPTPSFTVHDPAGDRLAPMAARRDGATAVRYDAASRSYRFTLAGDTQPSWSLDLTHPDVQRGRISLRQLTTGRYPAAGAGLYYRMLDDSVVEPRLFALDWTVESLVHAVVGASLIVTVTERLEDVPHRKRYTLTPVGRAIALRAQSLDGAGDASGRYAGFTAGDIEGGRTAVGVRIPYMDSVPVTFVDGEWFTSALLDVPQSHANALSERGPGASGGGYANELTAFYDPDALGLVPAVDETAWLTWSADVRDTFAVPPGPVAPYRAGNVGRVHATLVNPPPPAKPPSFDERRAYAVALAALGVTDLVVHAPDWRAPDAEPPREWPPDATRGGEAGWRALGAVAILAPSAAYTLTVAGCPGQPNPDYRASERVTGRDSLPKAMDGPLSCGDGSTVPRYLLPPTGAARQSLEDADRWSAAGIRSITLDILGAWNPAFGWPGAPDNNLDFDSSPRHPGTVGASVAAYSRMFADLQHRLGPVWADGAHGPWAARYDTFYLGYLDGVSRSLSTGQFDDAAGADVSVVPDFALAVARPMGIGYGLGDVGRFFGADRGSGALSAAELDAWRATELAFGHAGAWLSAGVAQDVGGGRWAGVAGSPWTLAEEVKDYHLFLPLQTRYLDAPLQSVAYVGSDGRERTLAAALVDGLNLIGPRLVLRFGGPHAMTVWVNLGDTGWPVVNGDTVVDLPSDGWLIDGADVYAFSALVDGHRADFLRAPQWTLMDGRGQATVFPGGRTVDGLRIDRSDGRVIEGDGGGTVGIGR
ncbi:MAG: hypothetical protein ABI780_08605 [Ardenticatenales bacterium]